MQTCFVTLSTGKLAVTSKVKLKISHICDIYIYDYTLNMLSALCVCVFIELKDVDVH